MQIEPRFYSDKMKFNFPYNNVGGRREKFVNALLKPYKLVVVMGLPGTGKSTFLSSYTGNIDGTYSVWNRENIFKMIFAEGERDESLNQSIYTFEKDLIPKLLKKEHHKVLVDGWFRVPGNRTSMKKNCPPGYPSLLIVFDGPTEKIIERTRKMKKYKHLTDNDLTAWITDLHETTVWPTKSEGFTTVAYVNTFGNEGVEYLRYRLLNKSMS